ncbi:MAG TPA: hypothetical protein VNY05_34515 [Candidatus Acidoferrales bacterium]|jgi:hypothetical protein|nr:hypothetical protein [Candidatus Acidoferrales bacterium]
MRYRVAKLFVAAGLLLALWGLSVLRRSDPRVWVHPANAKPGPVRILQFYASVGTLVPGERAQLCYGVENAKAVRISPMMKGVYPTHSHCVEIVPEHTTHYTLQAEGFDGTVAIRSFTLAVQDAPVRAPENLDVAGAGLLRPVIVEG